jgi:hypothetical protein
MSERAITDEDWARVQRIYAAQDSLVFAFRYPVEIGSVWWNIAQRRTPQPFRVIAVATREEFLAQPEVDRNYAETCQYFYRAITE